MVLEDKIKELEDQIELKRAFLSVKVSFGKGNKFSDSVKEKVSNQIKMTCAAAAEGLEIQPATLPTHSLQFTDQEVNILKQVVSTVLTKGQNAPAAPKTPSGISAVVSQTMKDMKAKNVVQAQLLLLDNVDRKVRDKLQSGATVRLIGKMNDSTAFVEAEGGLRFHIPMDDLDFNFNK